MIYKHHHLEFQQNWLNGKGMQCPQDNLAGALWDILSRSLTSMAKPDQNCSGNNHTPTERAMTSKWVVDHTDYCQDEKECETVQNLLCHWGNLFGVRHRLIAKKILDNFFSFCENEPAVMPRLPKSLQFSLPLKFDIFLISLHRNIEYLQTGWCSLVIYFCIIKRR